VRTAGRREATKERNRAAILAAALEVFTELGFGAATIRDVVRRTNLASGTFYNYFPDKEAVLRAIVEEIATEVRARVRALRREATTVEDFVGGSFRAYVEFLVEDPRTFAFLRRNAGTIRTVHGEASVGAGVEELQADLEAGVAAGLLPEHDSHLLAAAMIGAGLEIGVRMLERDDVDVEAAVAFYATAFVGALHALGRARSSAPRPRPTG
jgi:AcrR family transcriptional regulator